MSLEEVLAEIRLVSSKVDDLTMDVDTLKRKERERKGQWRTPSWSRSRSPRHSPSREQSQRSLGEGRSRLWADRDPEKKADYSVTLNFSDEEEGVEGSQVVEVLEETHHLLTTSCTRSMSNETRKQTQSRYKLPKVDATRTPRVDHIMKTLAPPDSKDC